MLQYSNEFDQSDDGNVQAQLQEYHRRPSDEELASIHAFVYNTNKPTKSHKKRKALEKGKYSSRTSSSRDETEEDEYAGFNNDDDEPIQPKHYSTSTLTVDKVVDSEYTFVPPEEVEYPEPEPDDDDSYCFMCDYSQNSREMISNPRYTRLKKIVDDNFGLMKPLRLWEMIQGEYEKHLRSRTIEKKKWSLRSIGTHFTQHSASTTMMMEDSLKTMNSAMNVLTNQGIFEENKTTKQRKINGGNLRMYLTLFDKRKLLLKDISGNRSNNIA
jgi:hypothetical protein